MKDCNFEKEFRFVSDVQNPAIDFREFTLDNGLKVIMSKFGKIPTVVINTAYKVGSKDETKDRTGLAHLFEHLLFEGTANTSKGQFDLLLQERGGESNAYTSNDITSYYMVLPSNQLEFGLWLDSDRMVEFGIDEESLRVQKEVVHEEKMTYYENAPYGSVEEQSMSRLFNDCTYRWPVIGDTKKLFDVSLNEVEEFYNKFYVPCNAVLTIVGDIDYDRTIELVYKYYSGLKPSEQVVRSDFGFLSDVIPDAVKISDNVNIASDFIFYRTAGYDRKTKPVGEILSVMLSDGESSVLTKELVYNGNLVNEVETNHHLLERAGIFSLTLTGMKGKPLEKAVEKLDKIFFDINNGNFDSRILEKAKNKIETALMRRKSFMISIADQLTTNEIFYNDAGRINNSVFDYLNVTEADVTDFTKEFLSDNKRLILNYIPKF